jgi:sugar/nucleoside kinase (ribokinase family)
MGFAPEKALMLGVVCASESVMRAGAQTSYPTFDEARELIQTL